MSRPAFRLPSRQAHAASHATTSPRFPNAVPRPLGRALSLAMTGAILTAAWSTCGAQSQSADVAARRYDIPAGPLNATLNRYTQEAGVLLSAPGALTRGRNGPGLSGEATVEQGFARLLQGQGLQAVRQADGTYTLRRTATPDATTTLPTVRVTAEPDPMKAGLPKPYAGGQVARGGRVGILGNQDTMATPFSTTSYTSRMIEDWQADTVAQVLLADPSVREISPEAGPTENFNMRGFYLRSEDFAWNGLFGLVPYNRVPTEFLERVEVLKGPGALLYGMAPQGSVGATINLVPKRAGAAPLTRLTASFASHSNLGAHLDLGRRFGADDAFGIRVNAVKSSGRTALDGQSERKDMGALALDYHGERLRATLDAYLNDDRQRGNIPLATSFATAQIPSPPDPALNAMPGTYSRSRNNALIGAVEFDFNPRWTGFAMVGVNHQKGVGYLNDGIGRNAQPSGDYIALAMNVGNFFNTRSSQAGVRGQLRTGPIRHTITLGANAIEKSWGAAANRGIWMSNLYAPTRPTLPPEPTDVPKSGDSTLSSIALADTLSFMEDKFLLTLGARRQRVLTKSYHSDPSWGVVTTRYDQHALTPALGFVIAPWSAPVSVYANYIEGLSQGGTVSDATAANFGEAFPPYQTRQMELGAKYDAGTLLHTLSLFQIARPNLIKDFASNTYAPDGRQRNRGIEWTVAGEIGRLRLLGGVTYLKAIQTRTQAGLLDGKTATGVPTWLFNLGAEWDTPWLPGLTLRAAAFHTGEQFADNANTQTVPAWTRVDLGVRYATRLAAHNVVWRGAVTNAFNRRYWASADSASVGAPRSLKLAVSMDF